MVSVHIHLFGPGIEPPPMAGLVCATRAPISSEEMAVGFEDTRHSIRLDLDNPTKDLLNKNRISTLKLGTINDYELCTNTREEISRQRMKKLTQTSYKWYLLHNLYS